MLTDEQVAARTDRARDAAAAAGRDLGLTVTEPEVLYNVFSVIVHLKPSPVVVRVPTVLPPWLTVDEQTRDQRRELAVTGWLADNGHPVVAPSSLVAREPVSRDGFSMTFWQFVEQTDEEISPERSARRSAQLHTVLGDYPGELSFMGFFEPFMDKAFEFLTGRTDLVGPGDLDRAVREWRAVRPLMTDENAFRKEFPRAEIVPIHGDSPVHNLIATPQGELWSDFELVTRGPVEWDMAFVGAEAEQAYAAATGKPMDERLLRLMEGIRMLQLVACYAQVPDMPSLGEGMRPALDIWRSTKPVTSWI